MKPNSAKSVRRAKSYKLTDETKARIRIIAAQSFLSDDEVVEQAVDLLYSLTPKDRDARINLRKLSEDVIAKCLDNDSSDVNSNPIMDTSTIEMA